MWGELADLKLYIHLGLYYFIKWGELVGEKLTGFNPFYKWGELVNQFGAIL